MGSGSRGASHSSDTLPRKSRDATPSPAWVRLVPNRTPTPRPASSDVRESDAGSQDPARLLGHSPGPLSVRQHEAVLAQLSALAMDQGVNATRLEISGSFLGDLTTRPALENRESEDL